MLLSANLEWLPIFTLLALIGSVEKSKLYIFSLRFVGEHPLIVLKFL